MELSDQSHLRENPMIGGDFTYP